MKKPIGSSCSLDWCPSLVLIISGGGGELAIGRASSSGCRRFCAFVFLLCSFLLLGMTFTLTPQRVLNPHLSFPVRSTPAIFLDSTCSAQPVSASSPSLSYHYLLTCVLDCVLLAWGCLEGKASRLSPFFFFYLESWHSAQ